MNSTVVIAGFFPPPITGQGLATARLAELLSDSHSVVTVNLRSGGNPTRKGRLGQAIGKIARYSEAYRRLAGVLREHPTATVLWTSLSPEPLGHLRDLLTVGPAFQEGQRVFGVVHWGRFSKMFGAPASALTAKRLVKRLDGLVFLNRNRADDCAKWIPASKRIVIPNTLDDSVVCSDQEVASKQENALTDGPMKLLFLSHMIAEKGYRDLLEAVRVLSARGVSVHATFAGQWSSERDREKFERDVFEYELQPRVTHVGSVSERRDVKALHLAADVFVLPSYMIEGQPLAIIEAMNAGTPVVTTNVGGMAGMLKSGKEGFLVEARRPNAIADAIEQLTPLPKWRAASIAARATYLTEYDPTHVARRWIALVDGPGGKAR